jgi:nicotinate-nucleotide adenylyltransferase
MIRQALGLFGGTFDPVHQAHRQMAQAAWAALPIHELRLIPAGWPPHRETPHASAEHRLAMLRLAIEGCEGLRVDDRETHGTLSYTVDTLDDLRAEYGPAHAFVWVLGADALASIEQWKDWQRLPALCHFAVLARPGYPLHIPDALGVRVLTEASALCEEPAGGLFVIDNAPVDISASALRAALAADDVPADWLHPAVRAYIENQRLYRQP